MTAKDYALAFDSSKINTNSMFLKESKGDKKKQNFFNEEFKKKECGKNKKIIKILSQDEEL